MRAEVRHALGFSYKTDKVIDTREGGVVRSVTIIVPPNVGTLEFLLRARMPAVYGPKAAESS